MIEHPETVNKPIIGAAVQSILVRQFRDELQYGQQDYENGTHKSWLVEAEAAIIRARAANLAGDLSWTDLLLASAFECAGTEDDAALRVRLTALAMTAVQWIESLDRKHGV